MLQAVIICITVNLSINILKKGRKDDKVMQNFSEMPLFFSKVF